MNSYEKIYNMLVEGRATSEYTPAREAGNREYRRNVITLKDDPRRQNPSIAGTDAERLRKARLEKHAKLSDAPAKDIPGSVQSLKVRIARKARPRRAARGGYR